MSRWRVWVAVMGAANLSSAKLLGDLAAGKYPPGIDTRTELKKVLDDLSSREMLNGDASDLGGLARAAFRRVSRDTTRKQLGQYLTPESIVALACAATITNSTDSVIDPTCGDGEMLWGAHDRLVHLGTANPQVVGIEIDDLAAAVARIPPSGCSGGPSPVVIEGDTFVELAGRSRSEVPHLHEYDVVVGNPPYIRYQDVATLLGRSCPQLSKASRQLNPSASNSQLVSNLVKACLVAHLVSPDLRPKRFLETCYELLADPISASLDTVDCCWVRMVNSVSGLADLSASVWLQSWLLARPNGRIAFITTNSFRKRDYGRLLRYFMVRFLQPLATIEQEGNAWFNGAQVTTALMVFRARPRDEIGKASFLESSTPGLQIRVSRQHDLSDVNELCHLGRSTSVLKASEQLWHVIRERDGARAHFSEVSSIDEKRWLQEVLDEDSLSGKPVISAIDKAFTNTPKPGQNLSTQDRSLRISSELSDIVSTGTHQSNGWRPLSDCSVEVNQGLRTGCNSFFYVQKLNDAEALETTDGETESAFVRITEHQAARRVTSALKRLDALVPYAGELVKEPFVLVRLSSVFDRRLALLPCAVLRPGVRRQSSSSRWMVDNDALTDLVIVTGNLARKCDLEALNTYPKSWMNAWKVESGLGVLPQSIDRYITWAEDMKIEAKGRVSLIPELTAVATNSQLPRRSMEGSLSSGTTPKAPRWWFSLPIRPRHVGRIFIGRVIAQWPLAFLNSRNPALVDANFTTFTPLHHSDDMAWFAFLNSSWSAAWLETASTPLGGGALKIEASHLRQLPVPPFTPDRWRRLRRLGRELSGQSLSEDQGTLREIDRFVAEACARDAASAELVSVALRTFAERAQRSRKRA